MKKRDAERLAALKVTCNREDILRRLHAWDAQIVQLQKKYSTRLSSSPSQTSLSFASRLEWTPNRNRWPQRKQGT